MESDLVSIILWVPLCLHDLVGPLVFFCNWIWCSFDVGWPHDCLLENVDAMKVDYVEDFVKYKIFEAEEVI